MYHLKVLPGFDQECIKVGANLVGGIYGFWILDALLHSRHTHSFARP